MYIPALGECITVSPTIDTAAYAAGDLLGTKLSLNGAIPAGVAVGLIQSIVLVDLANQKAAIDVVIFESDPSATTFTNNAAVDIADADLKKVAGVVSIAASDYAAFADNAIATVKPSLAVRAADGNNLYACLVIRGSATYVDAGDIQLKVVVL